MNRQQEVARQRVKSEAALFAVMLERALRLGYWDGVEPIWQRELGLRVPARFFANCTEAIMVGREEFLPWPASRPCAAPPGSLAKISALRARVQAGEELYHPADTSIEVGHERPEMHHGGTEDTLKRRRRRP